MVAQEFPAALAPGFADPVLDSQGVFRAVMEALARPGTPQRLPVVLAPPAPLTPALAAIALTLADHEAPLWLDPPLADEPAVGDWLQIPHRRRALVTTLSRCQGASTTAPFDPPPRSRAAARRLSQPPRLVELKQAYPDRSTTWSCLCERRRPGRLHARRCPALRDDGAASTARAPQLPGHFAAR